jgi:hypothetical protein
MMIFPIAEPLTIADCQLPICRLAELVIVSQAPFCVTAVFRESPIGNRQSQIANPP